jgi:hypothetical protein
MRHTPRISTSASHYVRDTMHAQWRRASRLAPDKRTQCQQLAFVAVFAPDWSIASVAQWMSARCARCALAVAGKAVALAASIASA